MGLFTGRKIKMENAELRKELLSTKKRIVELEDLCEEKDGFFKEMISDGLRHGVPLAAKHMSDRKQILKK